MKLTMIAMMVAGGCGQHGDVHDDTLPVECDGDARRCEILTTYQGVNVYRNTRDLDAGRPHSGYGVRWQCPELFNRFFALRFGTPSIPGDAVDLFANAAGVSGLERRVSGGPERPVPGDAVVFAGGRHGHVAIVVAVDHDAIRVVEQNVPGDGTNRYRYDPATNEVRSGPTASSHAVGWIHATANLGPTERAAT